jgi:hypothetical protein
MPAALLSVACAYLLCRLALWVLRQRRFSASGVWCHALQEFRQLCQQQG